MNRMDKDLQKAIFDNTQPAADNKDAAWHDICEKTKGTNVTTRKKTRIWGVVAACLVIIIISGSLFTPTGRAAISRVIDLFEPEKSIVTEIEGEQETAEQQLQVGTTPSFEPNTAQPKERMTYVMYVDESKYTFESAKDIDVIKPVDFPETLPEVSMEITQLADVSKEQAAISAAEEIKQEYETVYEPYSVTVPFDAICIDAHDGDLNGNKETMPQWDSKVIKCYFIDNTQGGTFVIKMKYFVEAEEGHVARFTAMLNEFTIVPAEQEN